jgi:hypothetical protein
MHAQNLPKDTSPDTWLQECYDSCCTQAQQCRMGVLLAHMWLRLNQEHDILYLAGIRCHEGSTHVKRRVDRYSKREVVPVRAFSPWHSRKLDARSKGSSAEHSKADSKTTSSANRVPSDRMLVQNLCDSRNVGTNSRQSGPNLI